MNYQKAISAADYIDPKKMPKIFAAPDCIAWIKEHPVNTIYSLPENKPRIPFLQARDLTNLRAGFVHPWTPEFAEELKAEFDFTPFGDVPHNLSAVEEAAIASGKTCPRCKGTGSEFILSGGDNTPILAFYRYDCPCDRVVRFYQRWKDTSVVPELFRNVRMDTLKPFGKLTAVISKQDQQAVIDAIKAHPTHSFFLYGTPGKGKTHMLTALFRFALENEIVQQDKLDNLGPAVFRVTTNRLLSEIRQWSLRKEDDTTTPVPTVTVRKLQECIKAGFRISLFLDEFDKIKASDWEMIQLCDLINMVYESNGQVVATSNKSPNALMEKWDSDLAGTTIRRIGIDPISNTAHLINFDKPKVKVEGKAEPKVDAPTPPPVKEAGQATTDFNGFKRAAAAPPASTPTAPAAVEVTPPSQTTVNASTTTRIGQTVTLRPQASKAEIAAQRREKAAKEEKAKGTK